jgi:hypothetical protein
MDTSVPPPTLDDFRVIEYAIIDDAVQFTGRLKLYANDEKIGAVPCLAICEHLSEHDLLLVHCDNAWNVLAVQAWNSPRSRKLSIGEIKERAEDFYCGINRKWKAL